mgnify:CR=1 FL=1
MLARKDAVLTGFCILPVFYELQLSKPIKRYKRSAKVFAHVYIAFSVTTQRLFINEFLDRWTRPVWYIVNRFIQGFHHLSITYNFPRKSSQSSGFRTNGSGHNLPVTS